MYVEGFEPERHSVVDIIRALRREPGVFCNLIAWVMQARDASLHNIPGRRLCLSVHRSSTLIRLTPLKCIMRHASGAPCADKSDGQAVALYPDS